MAWIELHQQLRNHPKLLHLKALLVEGKALPEGLSSTDLRDFVRSKLENLWLWALDYCLNGRLTVAERPISAAEIADGSEWNGDATLWLRSLIDSHWIDEKPGGVGGKTMYLHDWQEYAGKLLEAREKDRNRKKAGNSGGTPSEFRPDSTRTVPNPTVPNRTKEGGATPPSTLRERSDNGGEGDPGPLRAETVAAAYSLLDATIPPEKILGHVQRAHAEGIALQEILDAVKRDGKKMKIWTILDLLRDDKARKGRAPASARPKREGPSFDELEKKRLEEEASRKEEDKYLDDLPPLTLAEWNEDALEKAKAEKVHALGLKVFIAAELRQRARKALIDAGSVRSRTE